MNTCPFCLKPYAYPLPHQRWYEPPLTPTWTNTTTSTNVNIWISNSTSPLDYCYGHTFVQCADCGFTVAYLYHSQQSCAFLHGLRQGLDDLQQNKTIPLAEYLSEHIDVPDVFQDAFAEKEVL